MVIERKIRVLLTKHVLEAHDRGLKTVLYGLKDRGMEVVYTQFGLPEEIVKTALEEDVDVIGISSSVGGHMYVVPEVMRLLKEKGMERVLVIVGGLIQGSKIPELLHLRV